MSGKDEERRIKEEGGGGRSEVRLPFKASALKQKMSRLSTECQQRKKMRARAHTHTQKGMRARGRGRGTERARGREGASWQRTIIVCLAITTVSAFGV